MEKTFWWLRWKLADAVDLVRSEPMAFIEYAAMVTIPLVIIVILFGWRVKRSMIKYKKRAARKERLLRRLGKEPEIEPDVSDSELSRLATDSARKTLIKDKDC